MVERAREVFSDVYLAQETGDPAAVKADDLFPQVAAHLQEEIRQAPGGRPRVEYRNLCVRKVELVLVRNFAGTTDDEFVARISADAQKVIRQNGSVLRQDEYVTPFEEYWTFGRHEGQWKLKEVLPPARASSSSARRMWTRTARPSRCSGTTATREQGEPPKHARGFRTSPAAPAGPRRPRRRG